MTLAVDWAVKPQHKQTKTFWKSKRITTVDRRKKIEMSASVSRFCDKNCSKSLYNTEEPIFTCFNVNEHFRHM